MMKINSLMRFIILSSIMFMCILLGTNIECGNIENQQYLTNKKQEVSKVVEQSKQEVTRQEQPKPKVEEPVKEETFTLTFYTDLPEENGPYGAITCNGERLQGGMVANNVLPQGTIINTKEFGQLRVADRGGKNFNTRRRLDVFIPRNKGESKTDYKKRVTNMGIVKIKGVVKQKV